MSIITSPPRRSSAEYSIDALSLTDRAPSNFNPERFPILARHWFGLRPAGTAYPPPQTCTWPTPSRPWRTRASARAA